MKLIILAFVILILTACGASTPAAVTPTAQPIETSIAQTVAVQATIQAAVQDTQTAAAPTATPTVAPTSTPLPPTSTPIPTDTPTPTPDQFARFTVQQAADAILDAGLEFESPSIMAPGDYGAAPMLASEGLHFLIPSLCANCGGRLFSFTDQASLDAQRAYYDELGRKSALFFSWTFANHNLLLQINGELPESQARLYEAALNSVD